MTNLLKAMSFWIWGLIAIVLSISLLTVSHRLNVFARRPASPIEAPASESASKSVRPNASVSRSDRFTNSPSISRVIAADILAAEKALQSEQWPEALARLDSAQSRALSGAKLTAFDISHIEYLRGYVLVKQNQQHAAQEAYERSLAGGELSVEETVYVLRRLFGLTATSQQFVKALEYSQRLAAVSKLTPNDCLIVAQLYFLSRDTPNTVLWSDKAIAAYRGAGLEPPENLYLFKLQTASDRGDTPQMSAVLFDLIRLNNKPKNWNTLLRIERQSVHDDHNTLQIDRLMFDTNAMTEDSDFFELANFLSDAGNPGEAVLVLKTLEASTNLKPEHRERFERLLNEVTQRADTDVEKLSPNAARLLMLANITEGAAHTFGAPTEMERSGTRHQTERPDELNLYIARVLVVQGDFPGARRALQKFCAASNPTIAALWKLYADTLPETEKPV